MGPSTGQIGSGRVGSNTPIVWVTLGDTSVTLDAVGKFTFSELHVLLKVRLQVYIEIRTAAYAEDNNTP